jgi:membrane protein required for colicin V production
MSAMDVVFLVLFGLLTLRAFLRGFTGEIFSLASFALGLVAAIFFFKTGAVFLRTLILKDIPLVPEIMSFVILFLIVFIIGKILERMVKDIVDRLKLGGLNSFLGFILGMVEGIARRALILVVLSIQPLFNPLPLFAESIIARLMLPLIGIANVYV